MALHDEEDDCDLDDDDEIDDLDDDDIDDLDDIDDDDDFIDDDDLDDDDDIDLDDDDDIDDDIDDDEDDEDFENLLDDDELDEEEELEEFDEALAALREPTPLDSDLAVAKTVVEIITGVVPQSPEDIKTDPDPVQEKPDPVEMPAGNLATTDPQISQDVGTETPKVSLLSPEFPDINVDLPLVDPLASFDPGIAKEPFEVEFFKYSPELVAQAAVELGDIEVVYGDPELAEAETHESVVGLDETQDTGSEPVGILADESTRKIEDSDPMASTSFTDETGTTKKKSLLQGRKYAMLISMFAALLTLDDTGALKTTSYLWNAVGKVTGMKSTGGDNSDGYKAFVEYVKAKKVWTEVEQNYNANPKKVDLLANLRQSHEMEDAYNAFNAAQTHFLAELTARNPGMSDKEKSVILATAENIVLSTGKDVPKEAAKAPKDAPPTEKDKVESIAKSN